MALLSVIIPVYNEPSTIRQVVEKVNVLPIDKEIILVDDGSGQETKRVLRKLNYPNLKLIYHPINRGKGAAVRTGLSYAKGKYVIIQDADLEYDPNDYIKLLAAIKKDNVGLVLGTRFIEGYKGLLVPRLGNRFLTGVFNILFGVRLNDCFSCYKLMHRQTMLDLSLQSNSFDIEIEILAKILKKGLNILEVPIYYRPRTYLEGKKIKIKHGIWAILRMIRFRFA